MHEHAFTEVKKLVALTGSNRIFIKFVPFFTLANFKVSFKTLHKMIVLNTIICHQLFLSTAETHEKQRQYNKKLCYLDVPFLYLLLSLQFLKQQTHAFLIIIQLTGIRDNLRDDFKIVFVHELTLNKNVRKL